MNEGMNAVLFLFHVLTLLVVPVFAIGVINRTKSIWAGRKGPNLNQFFFDLCRLLKKIPVYSNVSSWIFQFAPWLILTSSFAAGLISPIVSGYSPISFSYDFVYFAYLLGLGRVFLILAALDTGSSFEGMGASREATYSALVEPALFFVVGTLGILSGHGSFQDLSQWGDLGQLGWLVRALLVIALFILLQIEAARIPVDDPNTHLELTMIHEVMVLDHSGPELAAIQYGAAIKLVLLEGLIASVLNPIALDKSPLASCGVSLAIIAVLSVSVGVVESLIARLRLRTVPLYAMAGVFAGVLSLILGILSQKGAL